MTAGKGRLGVAVLQISPELRTHFGAPTDRGVLVDAVRSDGPAARAGLRVGDVVTEVNGKPTRSAADVLDALSDRKKGDEVTVAVIRGGQRVELHPKLDTDPGPRWRVHRGQGFAHLPGDFDTWFPDGSDSKQLHDAIEDLRQRLEKLERQLGQQPAHGGTDRT